MRGRLVEGEDSEEEDEPFVPPAQRVMANKDNENGDAASSPPPPAPKGTIKLALRSDGKIDLSVLKQASGEVADCDASSASEDGKAANSIPQISKAGSDGGALDVTNGMHMLNKLAPHLKVKDAPCLVPCHDTRIELS
jgi:hypothetical protein